MNTRRYGKIRVWGIFLAFLCSVVLAIPAGAQIFHRAGIEVRPVFVLPTHRFLSGENNYNIPIDRSVSFHLKYAFQNRHRTWAPTAYQGIGVSHHRFFYAHRPKVDIDWGISSYADRTSRELGTPTAFYLFQGARITRLGSRFSFHYEWNLGLSFGWKPYEFYMNGSNKVIGSKINAYLNANFYLNYAIFPALDLTAGVGVAHFSNGNTALPNAGLNTAGVTFGTVYHFNRKSSRESPSPRLDADFQRHISYETILFGAWRKKGVNLNGGAYASPHTYYAAGFNVAAMMNLGHKVRLGVSLDGVYDGSANIYVKQDDTFDYNSFPEEDDFITPPWKKQWAIGIAPQVDYVMPYFTLTLGFGANVLHGGGDLKSFYQKLALKIDLTHNTFLHIGYSLREFNAPNFLMLGIGMRFN